MFAKSKAFRSVPPSPSMQMQPRSLRLRLVIWYGTLLMVALVLFAVLVWKLTTDALDQGVESSVRAEASAAEVTLRHELTSTSPYWPAQLVLPTINAYQKTGTVVEVIDAQGNRRYDSDQNLATTIPFSTTTARTTRAGQTISYTDVANGEQVRVEAIPVYAPTVPSSDGTTHATGPVIGTLLVAKTFSDINAVLNILRTLLLLIGTVTLVGALLGGWAIAGRVLHPLTEIAKAARSIAAATAHGTRIGNLSQRVRSPGGRDEMAQVVDTFNEMLTNLDRATRAQRRFVADASHELRAPLTTIQGNLAFLQRHSDELPAEERRTMLSDAHAETLRLAQLVEELLLLAHADAHGDAPLALSKQETSSPGKSSQPQPVELDHTVLQLVRQFRGRLSGEEVRLKLEVGLIEPVRVQGDEESIRRVLLILLDNAFKYTTINEKGEAGRVIVSLQRTETKALLRVRDTGIGIDPADLPHIFERFYRADRARLRQGTGLGLSIAQALVEQSGGRITTESVPGQGSTFSVWLPLA
jgi:two-component system OmpR family sensor kinase